MRFKSLSKFGLEPSMASSRPAVKNRDQAWLAVIRAKLLKSGLKTVASEN